MPDARSLGAGRKRKTRFQPPRQRRGGGGGGGSLMRMLTLFLGLFTVAEAVGGSGHQADDGGHMPGRWDMAAGNARTDLYTGLPGDLITWLDDLQDQRLRPSSMRTL